MMLFAREKHFGELLRKRASSSGTFVSANDGSCKHPQKTPSVDTGMFVEPCIFGGNQGCDKRGIQIFVSDIHPVFGIVFSKRFHIA